MRLHKLGPELRIVANPHRSPLESDLERRVQTLWELESRRRASPLFNGRLLSIEEISQDSVTGVFVEYRWFVAQQRQPDLFDRLRIRPLAVSGMIESPDGLIFGRRGTRVLTDAGKWELAPSGGLDADTCLRHYSIDYMKQFFAELFEEVGVEAEQITGALPLILIEDESTHVFDLAIAAHTPLRTQEIDDRFMQAQREYSEIRLVKIDTLSSFVTNAGISIVPTTLELLRYRGFIDHRL